jgi:hypothetical protein
MTNTKVITTLKGLCIDDASPTKLALLLREFDGKLAEFGVNLDTVLASGITPEEVHETFAAVDLVPPDELVVWYGWHNGLRLGADNRYVGMSPFAAHANLDWSIANYRYKLAEAVPAGLWAEKWLCVESDRGLAVYCSGNPTELPLLRREEVEEYDFVEPSTDHQIVSLCTMVAWWIEALDVGAAHPSDVQGRLAWTYDAVRLMSIDRGTLIVS